jgi:hypothetical protein
MDVSGLFHFPEEIKGSARLCSTAHYLYRAEFLGPKKKETWNFFHFLLCNKPEGSVPNKADF